MATVDVYFLGGPTASGKGDLAKRLTQAHQVELVLCDSVKVYRGLEIGANKPPPELRSKLPIHLVDVCKPTERFSAGRYARMAAEVITGIYDRGRIPLVVGGTLLFARALFDGLSRAPETDPDVARELQTLKTEELGKRLSRRDPESARRIHPNDRQRLLRALAVYVQTGLPLSDFHAEPVCKPFEARVRRFALMRPRNDLYERINRRSVRMFSDGLLDEVERLLESGIPEKAPALQTIGYIQAVACLRGKIGLEQAMADTARATRRLAKRQLTQIRSDNRFKIINLDEHGLQGAYDLLARELGTCS